MLTGHFINLSLRCTIYHLQFDVINGENFGTKSTIAHMDLVQRCSFFIERFDFESF